jgi:hypothetical protein
MALEAEAKREAEAAQAPAADAPSVEGPAHSRKPLVYRLAQGIVGVAALALMALVVKAFFT